MNLSEPVRPVVIIGSGPAGLTAAIYAARAALQPLVLGGAYWGGQLVLTSDVENFPGYPAGVQGPEMMDELRVQAERFGAEVRTVDVTKVDFSRRPFVVETDAEVPGSAMTARMRKRFFVYSSRVRCVQSGRNTCSFTRVP